jgi:hypothetical protein
MQRISAEEPSKWFEFMRNSFALEWALKTLKTRTDIRKPLFELINHLIPSVQKTIHNRHLTIAVYLAQHHLFRYLYTTENNGSCNLVAYQGDGHRLRKQTPWYPELKTTSEPSKHRGLGAFNAGVHHFSW